MTGMGSSTSLEVETMAMYQKLEGFLDLQRLGAGGWEEVYWRQREGEDWEVVRRVREEQERKVQLLERSRRSNQLAGKQGVMYVSLDGGGQHFYCFICSGSAAAPIPASAPTPALAPVSTPDPAPNPNPTGTDIQEEGSRAPPPQTPVQCLSHRCHS